MRICDICHHASLASTSSHVSSTIQTIQTIQVIIPAFALLSCRYFFRCGFCSSSGARLRGVHFGWSLKSRMALMYCSHHQRLFSLAALVPTHVLAIRGKAMEDAYGKSPVSAGRAFVIAAKSQGLSFTRW